MKRVYALLLFKSIVKNNSMNKKIIEKFAKEIIVDLKKFAMKNPKEEEIINEIRFCVDRLVIYLLHGNVEMNIILQYLEVETEQEYISDIVNYDQHTKFEEILRLKIFEKIIHLRNKNHLDLVIKNCNSDFDFTYLTIVYNYIKDNKFCLENQIIDAQEYKNFIDNLEKYLDVEDFDLQQSIFKLISYIYTSNPNCLEPFETSKYLTKLSIMLDHSNHDINNACIRTISSFISLSQYDLFKMMNHGNLMRLLNAEFWKFEYFESICKFIVEISKNRDMRETFRREKLIKSFLDHIFSINTRILDENELRDFHSLIRKYDEYDTDITQFFKSFLRKRCKKSGTLTEDEIIADINFFGLLMHEMVFLSDDFDELHNNIVEFTLEAFDKIINNSFSFDKRWNDAFTKIFTAEQDESIFKIIEIPAFYFLQKIGKFLPELNDETMEDVKSARRTLTLLERYLYVVCNYISSIENFLYEKEFLRISNVTLIFAMNLLPSLFMFRSKFTVHSNPMRELPQIIEAHTNMTDDISSLLGVIWNELIYLVYVALQCDPSNDSEMTKLWLEHIYKKEPAFNGNSLNAIHYNLLFKKSSKLLGKSSAFYRNLIKWKPKVKIIELKDTHKKEYIKFAADLLKNIYNTKELYAGRCFYEWITENRLIRNEQYFWKPEEICITLDMIDECYERNYDFQIDEERFIFYLIFSIPGFEKRNVNIINRIMKPDTEERLFQPLVDLLIDYYYKHFDFKNKVNYKGVFKNVDFVNKLIEHKNFISFIHNNIVDIPTYYVNHVFINSKDFLDLYMFVLESLTFEKIETDKEKLRKIVIDPNIRVCSENFFEMKINLETISINTKQIMESENYLLLDKIKYCIAMLKYLSSSRTILKVEFYTKILKFALKSINDENTNETNVFIKCLIHHLFEGTYDVMTKKNLFDGHLKTYRSYIEYYDVLAYTDINGLKARFERRLCNVNYLDDISESGYKIVLDQIHEHLFTKLLRKGFKDLNALNLATEILINNQRYSKYITEEFVDNIIQNNLLRIDIKDKILDTSDCEVVIKFLATCLKSDNSVTQNYTLSSFKKALTNCHNSKICNIVIILYRSLDFIDVVTHKDDTYVATNKLSELSGKFISYEIMNILIKRLTSCNETDFKFSKKYQNLVNLNVENGIRDYKLDWNNFDSKLAYVYSFISTVYKNYFVDSVDSRYDYRSEIWPYGDNFKINKEHKLSTPEKTDLDVVVDDLSIPSPNCKSSGLPNKLYRNRDKLENTFRRIYMSYFLYNYQFINIEHNEKKGLPEKINKWFEREYNLEDLNKPIEKFSRIDLHCSELDDFINLSGLSEIPVVDTEICHKDSISNNREDPKFGLIKENGGGSNEIINSDQPMMEDPDLSIDEINKMTPQKFIEFLNSRFNRLTSGDHEAHASAKFIKNISEIETRLLWVECEDRIAKTHALKLTKKKVDCPRDSGEIGVEHGVICKFLTSFKNSIYLCQPEISEFFKVVAKNMEVKKLLSSSIEKLFFLSCSSSELDLSEIKNALILIKDLKKELQEKIENNINWVRLLILLTRYPELAEHTLYLLQGLDIDVNVMTTRPLVDKHCKLNKVLIDIPEEDISKKLLWNFKQLIKHNVKNRKLDVVTIFLDEISPTYVLDLICMCLRDQEVLKRGMTAIYEIYSKFFSKMNEVHQMDFEIMCRKFELLYKPFYFLDFRLLYENGAFDKERKINRINSTIYEYLHQAVRHKYKSPADFLRIVEIYEGFINLLTIFTTDGRDEKIEQYAIIRSKFENEMAKNSKFYNDLYRNDFENTRFLVRFNFITFINKKIYFRQVIRNFRVIDGDQGEKVFEVFVDRFHIVEDSYDVVMGAIVPEFKYGKLRLYFVNEDGYDEGGLTKEWLEDLAKGITNIDFGLFAYSSDKKTTLQPFKGSGVNIDHLKYFKFVGRVMGKAIIDGYNFPLNLDKTVYKFILNKKCDLSDLESVDPQFYNSLLWMRDNPIKDVLQLTFTYENNDFGALRVEDLKPDGGNIPVTDMNKKEYIDLIIQKKFRNSIHDQLSAIKTGLTDMVNENLLSIFNEKELELLICGVPEIDVEDWKNNTIYNGYTKSCQNIIWFWQVVSEFSSDEKAKLLHFCTGSSRVPFDGFANLHGNSGRQKFNICKMKIKRLPTAHTCFNQLDLPEYSTYEELRNNIIYAINECHGTYGLA